MVGAQVPAGAATDGADVDDAVGEHRLDRDGVCVVAVVDRDQVGECEVGQLVGQPIEIDLHAHELRIRSPSVGVTYVHSPKFVTGPTLDGRLARREWSAGTASLRA